LGENASSTAFHGAPSHDAELAQRTKLVEVIFDAEIEKLDISVRTWVRLFVHRGFDRTAENIAGFMANIAIVSALLGWIHSRGSCSSTSYEIA